MKKPWNLPPGSQGCSGAGRLYVKKRRGRGQGGRLLLACVTLVQAVLSLDGEGVQVLLTAKKETKS